MYKAKVIYSKESIEETKGIYLSSIYRRFILIGLAAAIFIFSAMYINTLNSNAATKRICYVIGLVSILIIVLISVLKAINYGKQHVKNLVEQINTIYHTNYVVKEFELSDGLISVSLMGESPRTIRKEDILKVKVTENYVAMLFKGRLSLCIDKSSIEGGSVEDFINSLK